MILVFGSINIDLVARVTAIPRPGETVLSARYDTLFGGKGANQAVAAARASEAGRVAMAGRVGSDAFGASARANLDHNGVQTDLIAIGEEPTGCAFITVDERGENAITVASGANAIVAASMVPASTLDASTLAVLQMEVPFTASLEVARRVREAGGQVVWNFAPAPPAFRTEDLSKLLGTTDVFIVNEHEAIAAAEVLGHTTTDFEQAGAVLSQASQGVCVVTAGARGAIACFPNGERVIAKAERIVPVDTTGAGDTFVGILASALDEGFSFGSALERAVRGASMACLTHGAQTGMPTRRELD
ncbi:ribokinase [Microvirga puerhi]|uniref:Ribokinase n=1 Tax=Microvirga puerhi TaxID=2876078 RepID=A0ABS7VKW0_9HYPH|nr:ribokinase [Microvirga puerhi]MBZ6075775.1 ribokinase [Microvirga puerhi]